MRLSERDQHAHIVSGPKDLLEAQVRARLAIVIVRVNEIDPDPLEALQRFAGGGISRHAGANLRIVDRNGAEEDPRSIENKIPSVDPKLACAKMNRPGGVELFSVCIQQRDP